MDAATRDLLLAQDGDTDAFSRVVRDTQEDLRRFCQWFSSPGDSLDDVVQETYLRAYKRVNTFRGDASAKSWLFSIARHVCLDHCAKVRRESGEKNSMFDRVAISPEDQRVIDTKLIILQIPLVYREAFVLVRIMGYSYEEAGQILAVPIGTVQSRVARARHFLVQEYLEIDNTRRVG